MGKLANEIKESLEQAAEHSQGKRDLRTTVVAQRPKALDKHEIKSIRLRLRCSQAVFARALNVSVKTYQSWEHGTRSPSGPALKLLAIAAKNPEMVLE